MKNKYAVSLIYTKNLINGETEIINSLLTVNAISEEEAIGIAIKKSNSLDEISEYSLMPNFTCLKV